MVALLFPKEDNDPYLNPREVASRLAQSLPELTISWPRGNEAVEASLQKLLARNTPKVIIASHRALFGNCFYFEASFLQFPDCIVTSVVYPQSRISLKGNQHRSDFLEYAAREVATALGYQYQLAEE